MMKTSYCSVKNKKDFERIHHPDLAVVGGGMAGVAAAVTGARLGLKTILMQNRFCLGGPASAECDCDADGGLVCGASEWVTRDARETGVIEDMRLTGEFLFENGWRNYWSQMLRDLCENEKNLTLLLNTEVYAVETEGSRIKKLTARDRRQRPDPYHLSGDGHRFFGRFVCRVRGGRRIPHGARGKVRIQRTACPG